MAAPLTVLDMIHPQIAFMLITSCINARPQYLSRVTEPHLFWNAAELFDQAIDNGIGLIINSTPDANSKIIRSLPQRFSGLGIPRFHSSKTEEVCKATRQKVVDFINEYRASHPFIHEHFESWPDLPDRSSFFNTFTSVTIDESLLTPEHCESPSEAFLEDLGEYKSQWLAVYYNLRGQENRDHLAAWFLSSCSMGAGQWLNWKGGSDARWRHTENEFLENLRLRLMIDPFHFAGEVTCPQCENVSFTCSPLHALDCNRLSTARLKRHNKLRDLLITTLKSCFPMDNVQKEGPLPNGPSTYFADVLWLHGSCSYIIDVSIVDPSAPTYRRLGSTYTTDIAASVREQAKMDGFARTLVEHSGFIPFVVEATGRLGSAARRWMDTTFSSEHKRAVTLFTKMASTEIMKWNARMLEAGRVYLHPRVPLRGR